MNVVETQNLEKLFIDAGTEVRAVDGVSINVEDMRLNLLPIFKSKIIDSSLPIIIEFGEDFKIQPYGTEALSTLRIEMGHVAGSELDGRTIPYDNSLEDY